MYTHTTQICLTAGAGGPPHAVGPMARPALPLSISIHIL